jgi:hypothetical protein
MRLTVVGLPNFGALGGWVLNAPTIMRIGHMTLMTNWSDRLKTRPYFQLLLAIVACLGILYLLPKVISFQDESGFVFRIIWVAGKLWAAGQDPYGPSFLQELRASGPVPDALWYYPPYWYPIAVPLSYLPLSLAAGAWKAINFLLLIAASHLVARAVADISKQTYAGIFGGGLAFVCFMQAVATTIYVGQTSIIVYFGFAALIFGLLKRCGQSIVIGLVFLALKPHFGIVAFAAVAALPRYRWTLFLAGGLCILATAPFLFTGNYLATLREFVVNVTMYSGQPENDMNDKTGVAQILAYLFSAQVGSGILVIASSIISSVIFYFSSLNSTPRAENARLEVAFLALFIAAIFFVLPLGSYDIVVLAILFMMILAVSFTARWLVALGLVLCIRAGNLSSALGFVNPASQRTPDCLLISVALCLILVGVSWNLFESLQQRRRCVPST